MRSAERPFRVKRRRLPIQRACRLDPQDRTFTAGFPRSQECHKPTCIFEASGHPACFLPALDKSRRGLALHMRMPILVTARLTRATLQATIAGARLLIQVDIGFRDAATLGTHAVEYPSLRDLPSARLRAYPPETVVAEKFRALVALGMLNSRMKDFFDLWAISGTFPFEGVVLSEGLLRTPDRVIGPQWHSQQESPYFQFD